MRLIQLYMDENSSGRGLVAALRSRGVAVCTPREAERIGESDEQQLAFATAHEWVIYTFNTRDFCQLHTEWLNAGREHSGIIVAPQKRFSIGEQFRRLMLLRGELSAEEMRNRIEFLTDWD